jgi:biotin synthase
MRGGRGKDAPTTGYVMVGDRCVRNCAFCTQARGSSAGSGRLSRVTWPEYELEEVLPALAAACERGALRRLCVQTVAGEQAVHQLAQIVPALRAATGVPVSASVYVRDLATLRSLMEAGLERAALALDASTPEIYSAAKGGSFEATRELLAAAAAEFPGRVSTHLIAGLGETEQELLTQLQWCLDHNVVVGLFAFTPVPGTALATRPPPDLAAYRRLQAAAHLIRLGECRAEDIEYDSGGRVAGFGAQISPKKISELLADGEAFRTSGCPECNRPYYNEKPGQIPYNYARPLNPGEADAAAALALEGPAAK